jgi:hypothetical protein
VNDDALLAAVLRRFLDHDRPMADAPFVDLWTGREGGTPHLTLDGYVYLEGDEVAAIERVAGQVKV